MREFVRDTWGTATSRGPGFEPQPVGQYVRTDVVGGYFVDLRAKTESPLARSPSDLPPAAHAQLALGWWERSLAGDPAAATKFLELSTQLERRGERLPEGLFWSYSVPLPKYGVDSPWRSAMAQGQAASVFVRAHLASGRDSYAQSAQLAVEPLLAGNSLFVSRTERGLVLEEVPSKPPSHILNGWIYALWGVWDVATGLSERRAEALFGESVLCLRRMVDAYDVGWWTRYSLYPHRRTDLAKPFYHRLHCTQAEIMYRLSGFQEFHAAARRWRGYDRPIARLRVLIQKPAFYLERRRRPGR